MMQNVSNDFHEAFKNPLRDIFIRIKMNDILYTEQNINSFEFDGGSMGGESFQIGATFANTIKIEFSEIIEGLKELDQIDIEIGIKTYTSHIPVLQYPPYVGIAKVGKAQLISYRPDEFEFVKVGTFFIKERVDPDRNENKTTVEAMDAFIFMGGTYESKLSYPAEIRRVALEIANLSGMHVKESSFANLSATKIAKPIGYTYRQAIGLIAQFEAGFATFDKDGLLDVRMLHDPNFTISPHEYHSKGLVKTEVMYRLGGISCKISADDQEDKIIYAGKRDGAQIVLENRVMTQNLLNSIYEKIKTINYYPVNVKWRGNPAVELGDWVTLTDLTGKKFKAPNLTYKMTYRGGLTAETSADTSTVAEGTTKYKGSLSQEIEYMREQIKNANGNNIYFGPDEPPHPKLNDIWFKENGPDTEMWIYKILEDGTEGWSLEVSSAPNEALKQMIKDAEDEAIKAQGQATEADKKAQQGLEKAEQSLAQLVLVNNQIDDVNQGMLTLDGRVVGLQTTVAGKADQSQVTQLSGQITQLVSDVEGNKTQITQLSDQYSIVVSDVEGNKAQITALQNNINLMVRKDDVVNQINISTEGILISGAKVQITGQTYIENAVIKSAHVESVVADKINTGTLNAAVVNVINLNASSITSGSLNAINIVGSTITGSIFRTESAGFMIEMLQGSISFKRVDQNVRVGGIYGQYDFNNKVSGWTILQVRGYKFSINSQLANGDTIRVIEVPEDSTGENPLLNIRAATSLIGSFKVNGDVEFTGTTRTSRITNRNITVLETMKSTIIAVGATDNRHTLYEASNRLQINNQYGMDFVHNQGGNLHYIARFNGHSEIKFMTPAKAGGGNIDIGSYGTKVWGAFNVYNGAKNAVHITRDGARATPAYETAESYLGDIGSNNTGPDSIVEITIEELFSDTVNTTEYEYQVFLQSYGEGLIHVSERYEKSFIVKSSKPNIAFGYEIKARRRGYEKDRLELQETDFEQIEEMYKEN